MKQRKVLIVDDDQIIRQQLGRELKRSFCNTFEACDGENAWDIFIREDIEILFLDIKLPDIDGLEFLAKVKEKKPNCEVIVITGFGAEEIAIQSLRRGAIDYLEKPLKGEELIAAFGRAQEKLTEKEESPYQNTVLVIDDDEKALHLLKEFLEDEGYRVLVSSGGKRGLEIIEENKVDVFITDVRMNDMNGIEVLERAKKIYLDIEGIVMTGYKDSDLAIKALRAGAIDYINKPINLDELLFAVEKAVENINLNRNRLYRDRERKISAEIIAKMNEELERRIEERSKELNQAQAQLFQTSKLATLGEMSAGIAHEINQPLGGIALICTNMRKLLERGKLSEDQIALDLKDIETSVNRMTKVIAHIRTFARQDTLKFVEVDIAETIRSAMSLLGEQLRLHDIEVILNLDEQMPKMIGEPYQLEQIWINLISNARDALNSKGEMIKSGEIVQKDYFKQLIITQSFDSTLGNIEIRFEDNGTGVDEKKRERIFEPFFTTKEVGKGSGLGLSISYGIIQKHKGNICVESKEGEGIILKVTLPILKTMPEEE